MITIQQASGIGHAGPYAYACMAVVCVVLLTTSQMQVTAQERATTLRANARLRLELPLRNPHTVIGQLVFIGPRSIAVRSSLGLTAVPWVSVSSVERSRGIHPGLRVVPPVLGAGLGALVGKTLFAESDRCRLAGGIGSECSRILSNEVVGAAWGALVLGLAGRLVARERWEHVSIDAILGSRPGSEQRIGLSIRW